MEMMAVILVFIAFIVITIWRGIQIVPQSEKWVVERLGRFRQVLGPGFNWIVPWLDSVRHKVSVLERQLPNLHQDAITKDNVVIQCDLAAFYYVESPESAVYRIRDINAAVSTTIAGIVRSEIGKMDLDEVQSNRNTLNTSIREQVRDATDDWGIVVTRAEVLDVNLDEVTREAMLQQLNAERARRAEVTRAEGEKRATELRADAQLYEAEKVAEAKRIQADAEAYTTETVAKAISAYGTEAVEFEIRKLQVKAMSEIGAGQGRQTILLPADIADAFSNAAGLFKKKS